MDSTAIPDGARGRPGMVAMLRRAQPGLEGRAVIVRHPVGFVSTLVDADRPVFAWRVCVLGAPAKIEGREARDIVVADGCLVPMCRFDAPSAVAVERAQARQDFDAALADLRRIVDSGGLTTQALERSVDRAAEIFAMQRTLEVVPVPEALREIGFRPASQGSQTSWHWSGLDAGRELYVIAVQAMFGGWTLAGRFNDAGTAMWDERFLPEAWPRGRTIETVLAMWRAAFGGTSAVPSGLGLGAIHERHRLDLRRLRIGWPSLDLDGEVFRATRRWIAARHAVAAGVGAGARAAASAHADHGSRAWIGLRFAGGMLFLDAPEESFACPGVGAGIDPCRIPLDAFVALPASRLRGARVRLEAHGTAIAVNGAWIPAQAGDGAADGRADDAAGDAGDGAIDDR